MKRLLRVTLSCLFLTATASFVFAEPVLVDRLVACVGRGSDAQFITHSDLQKPSMLAGFSPAPLEAQVDYAMQVIEAKNIKFGDMGLEPTEAAVNAQIERIKRALGVNTDDEAALEAKLNEAGLTLTELRGQVYDSCLVNQLWGFNFPDRAVVPLSAVEEYFLQNPEEVPAKVHLFASQLPAQDLQQRLDKVSPAAAPELLAKQLTFCDLGVLLMSELDEQRRRQVETASEGSLCVPEITKQQLADNVELLVLKVARKFPAHKRSLEERKAEIINKIEEQESRKRYEEYLQELKSRSVVKKLV